MSCFGQKIERKKNLVATVGQYTTNFAESFDRHTAETRRIIQELFQLLQKSLYDDTDDDINYGEAIKKLWSDYETSERVLEVQIDAAIDGTNKLYKKFTSKKKKKRGSSYSDSERGLLEYCRKPKSELPDLLANTISDVKTMKNKVKNLEQKLKSCENEKLALDSNIKELMKGNQELKTSIGSVVADNKDRQGQEKTKLMENELQSLNKPIAKEEERIVKRQDSTNKYISNNYGKQREYELNNDNQNSKNDHKVNNRNIRNVASEMTDEQNSQGSCSVHQEEYDDLKNKLKLYHRINDENKRLNDKINKYEQKLIDAEKQEKKMKEKMLHLEDEVSCFKSQLESKTTENKELHIKVDQIKKDTESFKCSVSSSMANDKHVLELIKNENEKVQRETRNVQNENSELNKKLQKCKEDIDIWQKRTLVDRRKNEQIIQEKASIETEMNEISRKLKVKIDEEKQLTGSLESRSAMINEEKCTSEKLKEEKEALRREKDKVQKLLNESRAEIVMEKEAANDCLSKVRIDYESRLKELLNLSTKVEHDASETEKKLKKKIYGLEQDLKKETEQNKQLKSQVKVLSEKITNLETEIRNEQEKNANKETQIETAAIQLKDVTKNHEELKFKLVQAEENTRSEMGRSNAKIATLTQDKTSLVKQLTGLKDNMQDLQTTLTTQKATYEAKISDLMHNMEQLQEKKFEAEKTLAALEVGHRELQQLYETAKEELDQFKRIKTIQIQLYYNSRSSLISKVEIELKSLLKRDIESNTTQVEFINREKVNDIDPNEPLLIICICASRLGTDAANAAQSLKLSSNMALLVFHHKDGHALPNQASEHVLTGNEYKRLGGIFDFGFLSGKGIYSCEMNDQNFRNIVHFIRKEH